MCSEESCTGKDLVGAHVRVAGNNTVYICPLCKKHNQETGVLLIVDYIKMVPADKSVTCDPPKQQQYRPVRRP
jgi:hypothetical protein